ncbi:SHOCT domain-containing protein [Actinomadura rudentiformis]|uniref:SHOCT domain-containing protein n=2 Tax=Actinomadura rudentiformis TaxID=359158 RepID=A0A6H9Z8V8_9ACTN|nr:SHOCT domain-containing protein [Actinomadura rudentiformis]
MEANGWSGWMWVLGPIMMVAWLAVITAVVWLVLQATANSRPQTRTTPVEGAGIERARGILAERLARGEIDAEDYQERLAKLT